MIAVRVSQYGAVEYSKCTNLAESEAGGRLSNSHLRMPSLQVLGLGLMTDVHGPSMAEPILEAVAAVAADAVVEDDVLIVFVVAEFVAVAAL